MLRGAVVAVAAVLALAAPASADDGTIAHVEAGENGLQVLVNVPPGAQVDLGAVTATLDGTELDATASRLDDDAEVRRTTILAIDTSRSMARKGRFDAAKQAAATYLDTVPDDVEVGIVTFDNDVTVALEPTTDRAQALAVVNGLDLALDTVLYDGVEAAVNAAGDVGQRTVLVLSDGADTGSTASLDDVTQVVGDTNTLLDVVALGLEGKALEPLRAMAAAGTGRVITSSGPALADAFRSEADVLAQQVLVTAPLPDGFDATQATVEVRLPTAGEPVVARALAPIQKSSAPTPPALPKLDSPGGWDAPGWLLYVGLGGLAVGLLAVAFLLVPGPRAPMSIAEHVEAYSMRTSGVTEKASDQQSSKPASEPVLEQAKAAAAGILEHNAGLDDRLKRRLSAAGSELKPSEWLLVHVGVVLAFGLFGLLIGQGSLVVGLVLLVVGAFVPPLYLSLRASRRRKAFNEALPEVLQLISGALSAGLSLPQAVDTVVREGPEPIAGEFKRVLVEARIGVSLEDAFDGVAARFESKDFAWTVMAIRIQRQVGGNLAELLDTVAATMRERAYLRRQVSTLSAEGRLSAYLLGALPPVFALYLFLTNREYLEPLVADVRGWALMAVGVLFLAAGSLWMSRIVKVDL